MVKIAISIMAADFSQAAVDSVSSADILHIDVMDGLFVSNKTVWSDTVEEFRTDLVKEVHLMVENPEECVEEFIEAGARRVSFHIEATQSPAAVIGLIQSNGAMVGIAVNPESPLQDVYEFLSDIDFVLIMSVKPGRGGQDFLMESLEKVRKIKKNFSDLEVEIDGGINKETAKLCKKAGVDILVSGSYIFSSNPEEKIRELR